MMMLTPKPLLAAFVITVICNFVGKGGEVTSVKPLVGALETLNTLATEAIPLAKEEFSFVAAKFKGDEGKAVIDCLRTAADRADVLPENKRKSFAGWAQDGNSGRVTEIMLEIVDKLRGLDAVLLAEALAGSTRQGQLLELYAKEEAAITQLSKMYEAWQDDPNRDEESID
jgi:hypothetical protein